MICVRMHGILSDKISVWLNDVSNRDGDYALRRVTIQIVMVTKKMVRPPLLMEV